MMDTRALIFVIACALSGTVQAQDYVVGVPLVGADTSISTGARVQQAPAVVLLPAVSGEIETLTSVPFYEPYEPSEFDAGAYQSATDFAPSLDQFAPLIDRSTNVPIGISPTMTSTVPVAPPVMVDVAPMEFPSGEIGFRQESETSRLLLALEQTHNERMSEMKLRHLAQRRALLDAFEKDASDPAKVIGLAGRMRTALAELDAAQAALLELENGQFTSAMLKVLENAPSRAE